MIGNRLFVCRLGAVLLFALVQSQGYGASSGKMITVPPAAPQPNAPSAALPPAPAAPLALPAGPESETPFIEAMVRARELSGHAANDLAKGAVRVQRREAICTILPSPHISGWVGVISMLSSVADGRGVLKVSIHPHVQVGTWNNAFSEQLGEKTLLDPASPVFTAASKMHRGDRVRFSGDFVKSDADCLKEVSVTMDGSLDDPDFLFRFSEISPVLTGSER